ncbi:MAG: thioredoxin family protein [Planctomycetaceae bacterium]|nr:thioredoxin family protein [Planctomycetaceae bacterium]
MIFIFFIFAKDSRNQLTRESSSSIHGFAESGDVVFLNDFNAAKEQAILERKPLVAFFTLSGNESCKRSFELFGNQEIRRLAKYFVCVSVDGALSSQICESYKVNSFPTVMILDAEGKEIQRLAGKETKEQLSIQMHIAIQLSTSVNKNKIR